MEAKDITVIMSLLWGISEALSLIPQVKANGIFHGIYVLLQQFRDRNTYGR